MALYGYTANHEYSIKGKKEDTLHLYFTGLLLIWPQTISILARIHAKASVELAAEIERRRETHFFSKCPNAQAHR